MQTTTLDYDGSGRLIKVTQPDPDGAGPLTSPVTTYEYYTSGDAANLLKAVIDPRGLETDIQYDPTRHVSQITERCGGTIDITSIPSQLMVDTGTTGYDPSHLATLIPSATSVAHIIDTAEHRVVFATGHDQYITRNANSQITSLTDAQGNTTQYSYLSSYPWFSSGLLQEVTQPDPDADGPLPALTTTYYYNDSDNPNHPSQISHPDGTYELWDYGPSARLPGIRTPWVTSLGTTLIR